MAEAPFGHEPSAVAVRRILQVGVVLGLAVVAVVVIVSAVLHRRLSPEREERAIAATVLPPSSAPRLETHPTGDLQALRKQKDTVLHSWGWTEKHEFAHIPIERAMALYVQQRALPAPTSSGRNAPAGTSPPEARP